MEFWSLDELSNVGHVVSLAAQKMGGEIAVAAPTSARGSRPIQYESVTFDELERRSNEIAAGIQAMGVAPGTRLALMVPPGLDFVAFVFGLFKAGVVVVLIDPGMGRRNMIGCLAEAEPEGIVGIRLAHLMRAVFRRKFPKCKHNVLVGGRWWPGCLPATRFHKQGLAGFEPIKQTREAEAAIIFTTGSTGPPKGVLYRHRIFLEQARQIRDQFQIPPGTVDVSGFPLFALFNCAMGATTVFPRMDATRPAQVDPLDIKDAVDHFQADQSFGSPALWNTVARYAEEHGLRLPTIKRVFTAGAPVPPHVLKRIKNIIASDGEIHTPYGATESLPVASNEAAIVLEETAEKTRLGYGTCVGHRFPDMQWRVIEISDDPIAAIEETQSVPVGQIGELIVRGAVVTDQYVTRLHANAEHKIKDGAGFWHRMGDVGYLDADDRFWFCGRKSHRVITANHTHFTVVVEGIANTHPRVYRSALVGMGAAPNQAPVLVVEPWPEHWPESQQTRKQLIEEILAICQQHEATQTIQRVYLKQNLPVDIRHNSKIFREQLPAWVESQDVGNR